MLSLSGGARADEEDLYERYRPKKMVLPNKAFGPSHWALLFDPDVAPIPEIMVLLAESIGPIVARDPASIGVDTRRDRLDLIDRFGLVDLIRFASNVEGVPTPVSYVDAEARGIRNANFNPPALLIGPELAHTKPSRSVTFAVAKAVCLMRPELYLTSAINDRRQLDVVLTGTLAGIRGSKDTASMDRRAAFFRRMARTLPTAKRRMVAELAGSLHQDPAHWNLKRWSEVVDDVGNRVGLLLCGDLRAAIKAIKFEADPLGGRSVEDQAASLIQFAVSEQFVRLRRALGLSVLH